MISLNQMPLSRKLAFFGMLGSACPLILFGAIAVWQGSQNEKTASMESSRLADADLEHIVRGVYAVVTSQQEVLQLKVAADLRVAANELAASGGAAFSDARVTWQAKNQSVATAAPESVSLRAMSLGGRAVTPNTDLAVPSPIVDKVRSLVGGACTVFQRMNDKGDMLRVVTNVVSKDGKRAISTYIPHANPDGSPNAVVQTILKGETFVGRAFVVNEWYVSAYQPLRDRNGEVAGMLFVGAPEDSAKSLREQITSTAIGQTGYVFVVDSKGTRVVWRKGEPTGDVMWEAKDAAGEPFIQNLVKQSLGLKPGEVGTARYLWKDEAIPTPRIRTARLVRFAPWDWTIVAAAPEEELATAGNVIRSANRAGNLLLAAVFAGCVCGSAFLWIITARTIAGPIRRAADMLKDIAEGEGDLTRRLEVATADEIGDMARYFNLFVEKLQGIITRIASNASTVASSATELSAVSTETAHSVQTISGKTTAVAAAAEEASASTMTMSLNISNASSNLESVASATEEMSSTISDLASNSAKARAVSEEANRQAQAVSQAMLGLGKDANEIGKVTETIMAISSQTSLLALNATIEAARAGAAGKGFSVVASEIKELAQQTSLATDEIKGRISAIQSSTSGAIRDIEAIDAVIKEMNEIVSTIAAAIEEQAAVTKEVATSISRASEGVRESNDQVTETATTSRLIAADISVVQTAVAGVASGGDHIRSSASELSNLAEQLQALVGRFRV
jgi:methyl-accepting chemotaxis protein